MRNYHRILAAAREVLGESGTDAGMEEIAARAGVGVGTVYRRFASKDALIDELLRLAGDVMALAWAMQGLVQGTGEVAPEAWQRLLDIHLAGMRAAGPLSSASPISARQLSKLTSQRRS